MEVKVINKSNNPLPKYSTAQSAGMDLRAFITEPIILGVLDRALIPTGLYIEMPEGYEAQVRPRSGLAIKHGITVLNSPGTIDADYRAEWGIPVINHGLEDIWIEDSERICQAILNKVERIEWNTVDSLDKTTRTGGFGSTNLDKNGKYIASK